MKAITSRLESVASGSDVATNLSVDNVAISAIEFLQSHEEDLNNGNLEWQTALAGRSFLLSSLSFNQKAEADDTAVDDITGVDNMEDPSPLSTLALWGSADFYSYANKKEGIDLNGDLFSAYVGVDLKPQPDLLTGLAIAMNRSGVDYTATDDSQGTYTINITSANPYISWSPSDSLSLWISAAYGRGTVERKEQGKDGSTTDSSNWTSFSAGTRLQLWQSPQTDDASSSSKLELKLDGATAQFMDIAVQQARLAASLSRSIPFTSGALTSAVELGLRMRSSDAAAVEIAGNINWQHPRSRFSSSATARALFAGGNQKEWGVSGSLNFSPGTDGSGFSFALSPSFGHNSSRLDDLWSLNNSDLAVGNNAPDASLKGELGYGLQAWDGILTPYSDFSLAGDGSRTIGTGIRYSRSSSDLELDLRAAQQSSASDNADWTIGLEARIGL